MSLRVKTRQSDDLDDDSSRPSMKRRRALHAKEANRGPPHQQVQRKSDVCDTVKSFSDPHVDGSSDHSKEPRDAIHCPRCLKRVTVSSDREKSIECIECHKWFHRGCYLADIGRDAEERSALIHQRIPCVVCQSGLYQPEWFEPIDFRNRELFKSLPRGWLRYRNRFSDAAWAFAATLLKEGFVVVPLIDAGSSSSSSRNKHSTVARDAGTTETLQSGNSGVRCDRTTAGIQPGNCIVELLNALRQRVERHHRALLHAYERQLSHAAESGKTIVSLATGYSNFRMRCGGRFEIVAPFIADATNDILAQFPVIREVMSIALRCDTPKQMSNGCFYAEAGAEGQNVHTDGPLLVEQLNTSPYAINCFVPLIPANGSNGTQFFPRTHLIPGTLEAPPLARVSPSVPVGHVLLFDYRVQHRGLPNKGGCDRPCVYATYSQPWYQDTYNFGTKRYAKELCLDEGLEETRCKRAARRRESDHAALVDVPDAKTASPTAVASAQE